MEKGRDTEYETRKMLFKRRCEIARGKLDIAPLIDVVLLLLIFFMLSSSMILPSALKVNLPQSSVASPQAGRKIRITINREGEISWQGKRVQMEELERRLLKLAAFDRGALILLEADRDVRHGRVVEIMSLAHKFGLNKLAIAAVQQSD
jgi:biopolymer transport protein ExbD